jgi:ribosomal protein S18 acetylase RimI-like enzyme
MTIIQLNTDHTSQYKALRLKGLQTDPEAFGALYEEEINQPDSFWESRLKNNNIFGAFEKENLIGIIHFNKLSLIKTKHRRILWGMYVHPEAQNKKIGSQLLTHLLEAAIKLYTKYGFKMYGTEPNSLYFKNTYYNEYLMVYTYKNN